MPTTFVTLFFAAGGLFACSDNTAQPKPQVVPVSSVTTPFGVAAPSQSESDPNGYVAVIAARESTDVAAVLSGRIKTVAVRLGDKVAAGAVLAQIDERVIREDLVAAGAAQRAAAAGLEQARVTVAEAARTLATEKALFAQGTSSRSDMDKAEFAHEKARAAERQADADLATHAARVAGLRTRLAQTRITAPYDGTISVRYLDPGTFVSSGTPIVRLIASDELLVRFAAPSSSAGRVLVADAVQVEIEPAGVTAQAVIKHVAPELDAASQMIIAEARLMLDEGDRKRVKAGQAARVYLRPQATADRAQP